MYMPTHLEDICLIPHLQNEIVHRIAIHPNHTHALCGDFNRDIALRGRQNNNTNTPPPHKKKITNGQTSPHRSILIIFPLTLAFPNKEDITTHQQV